MKKNFVLSVLCGLILVGCSTPNKQKEQREDNSEVRVFSLANAEDKIAFSALKLDDTHSNLLNRDISKDQFDVIWKSWTDIHKALNQHLINENFDWGVNDERIRLFNKIYFKKDGRVKYYVFGIRSSVSQEKMEAFGEIAQDFFADQKISLTRDADFAQCGKASLLNLKNQQL